MEEEKAAGSLKIFETIEDRWAAEEIVRVKSRQLALDRTLALNLPPSITLKRALEHLGERAASLYRTELHQLEETFGSDLPRFTGCASALYWQATFEGACWFEVSIAEGTILDNEYTRNQVTPRGYLERNGGSASALVNVPIPEQKNLLEALGASDEPWYPAVMLHPDGPKLDGVLSAVACLFFNQADALAAGGGPFTEVLDLVSEAFDLRGQSDSFSMWDGALTMAREDPHFQSELRSAQARKAALARLSLDPKQRDKAFVKECWEAWQNNREKYRTQAAFARDMLEKCDHVLDQRTIENWCRDWSRNQS